MFNELSVDLYSLTFEEIFDWLVNDWNLSTLLFLKLGHLNH